ncbi:MAG: hypothetical protein JXR42_00140 [Gammaproteobacteria bacterium]|nr:hypothetical protein [Gammaproteobacteria bacterium]
MNLYKLLTGFVYSVASGILWPDNSNVPDDVFGYAIKADNGNIAEYIVSALSVLLKDNKFPFNDDNAQRFVFYFIRYYRRLGLHPQNLAKVLEFAKFDPDSAVRLNEIIGFVSECIGCSMDQKFALYVHEVVCALLNVNKFPFNDELNKNALIGLIRTCCSSGMSYSYLIRAIKSDWFVLEANSIDNLRHFIVESYRKAWDDRRFIGATGAVAALLAKQKLPLSDRRDVNALNGFLRTRSDLGFQDSDNLELLLHDGFPSSDRNAIEELTSLTKAGREDESCLFGVTKDAQILIKYPENSYTINDINIADWGLVDAFVNLMTSRVKLKIPANVFVPVLYHEKFPRSGAELLAAWNKFIRDYYGLEWMDAKKDIPSYYKAKISQENFRLCNERYQSVANILLDLDQSLSIGIIDGFSLLLSSMETLISVEHIKAPLLAALEKNANLLLDRSLVEKFGALLDVLYNECRLSPDEVVAQVLGLESLPLDDADKLHKVTVFIDESSKVLSRWRAEPELFDAALRGLSSCLRRNKFPFDQNDNVVEAFARLIISFVDATGSDRDRRRLDVFVNSEPTYIDAVTKLIRDLKFAGIDANTIIGVLEARSISTVGIPEKTRLEYVEALSSSVRSCRYAKVDLMASLLTPLVLYRTRHKNHLENLFYLLEEYPARLRREGAGDSIGGGNIFKTLGLDEDVLFSKDTILRVSYLANIIRSINAFHYWQRKNVATVLSAETFSATDVDQLARINSFLTAFAEHKAKGYIVDALGFLLKDNLFPSDPEAVDALIVLIKIYCNIGTSCLYNINELLNINRLTLKDISNIRDVSRFLGKSSSGFERGVLRSLEILLPSGRFPFGIGAAIDSLAALTVLPSSSSISSYDVSTVLKLKDLPTFDASKLDDIVYFLTLYNVGEDGKKFDTHLTKALDALLPDRFPFDNRGAINNLYDLVKHFALKEMFFGDLESILAVDSWQFADKNQVEKMICLIDFCRTIDMRTDDIVAILRRISFDNDAEYIAAVSGLAKNCNAIGIEPHSVARILYLAPAVAGDAKKMRQLTLFVNDTYAELGNADPGYVSAAMITLLSSNPIWFPFDDESKNAVIALIEKYKSLGLSSISLVEILEIDELPIVAGDIREIIAFIKSDVKEPSLKADYVHEMVCVLLRNNKFPYGNKDAKEELVWFMLMTKDLLSSVELFKIVKTDAFVTNDSAKLIKINEFISDVVAKLEAYPKVQRRAKKYLFIILYRLLSIDQFNFDDVDTKYLDAIGSLTLLLVDAEIYYQTERDMLLLDDFPIDDTQQVESFKIFLRAYAVYCYAADHNSGIIFEQDPEAEAMVLLYILRNHRTFFMDENAIIRLADLVITLTRYIKITPKSALNIITWCGEHENYGALSMNALIDFLRSSPPDVGGRYLRSFVYEQLELLLSSKDAFADVMLLLASGTRNYHAFTDFLYCVAPQSGYEYWYGADSSKNASCLINKILALMLSGGNDSAKAMCCMDIAREIAKPEHYSTSSSFFAHKMLLTILDNDQSFLAVRNSAIAFARFIALCAKEYSNSHPHPFRVTRSRSEDIGTPISREDRVEIISDFISECGRLNLLIPFGEFDIVPDRTYAKNIFLKLFSDNFHFSA